MRYARAQRASHHQQHQQRQNAAPTASTNVDPSNSTTTIFFYHEYEKSHGYLCQWHPSPFRDRDTHLTHVFDCAEQYMMYHKALILSGVSGTGNLALGYDQDTRSRLPDLVLAEEKPGKQKALARSVRFTDAQLEEWDRIKSDVVIAVDRGLELVEASPRDRIWGIGFAAVIAEEWREEWGENLLGKALMGVRARLRTETEAAGGVGGVGEDGT